MARELLYEKLIKHTMIMLVHTPPTIFVHTEQC